MDSNPRPEQFGALLKSHRIRRGTTQRQLADLSTVSIRAIRDLELGRSRRPRPDTVRLIADGLRLGSRERARLEAAADDLRLIYGASFAPPPAPLDALVGRDAEVEVLKKLLRSGGHRLVSVTGVGGVGKTRVALAVAEELHHDAGFAVLWNSADDVPSPMRSMTGTDPFAALLRTGPGDPLAPPMAAVADLSTLLDETIPTLLVLDGHQPSEIRLDRVLSLLWEYRELRVLMTARTPFDHPSCQAFPLAPLAVPSRRAEQAPESLARLPAVRLLTDYVHRVVPDFRLSSANAAAIAELCRLLDGIPAALEALAAWFLIARPQELTEYVRTDPFSITGEIKPGMREALLHALSCLDAVQAAALDRLATVAGDWSMADAVGLTGEQAPVCARIVRRLLMLGLVRTVGEEDRARFQVLAMIRSLLGNGVGHRPALDLDC
jgi:transcriptional regulator with XRE-family HTH domain